MANQILFVTLQLLRFRSGPQDMPGNRQALLSVIAAYFLVAVTSFSMQGLSLTEALSAALLGISMLWIFIWGVLTVSGKTRRILQTMTSLIACNTALEVLSFIPTWMAKPWQKKFQENIEAAGLEAATAMMEDPPLLAFSLIIIAFFWFLCVMMHVLRHALETSHVQAAAIAILYPMVVVMLSLPFLSGA